MLGEIIQGVGIFLGVIAGVILFALVLFFLHYWRRRKIHSDTSKKWNEIYTDPPEYEDPLPNKKGDRHVYDVFKSYLTNFFHGSSSRILEVEDNLPAIREEAKNELAEYDAPEMKRIKNYFLWDDGMIFCGFKLQGADVRSENLYGAYLRDMLLRDRTVDGVYMPLVLRDLQAYADMDMSGTFLKNELLHDRFSNGPDIGRVDLSGLYLRDIGLQGIDISEMLEPEETAMGDYFIEATKNDK